MRATDLLLPVAALQGLWLQRTVDELPEATGPRTGRSLSTDPVDARTNPSQDSPNPLSVLVIGESSAAGCGAQTMDEAFPGAFGKALARRTGRPVDWQIVGRNGATVRIAREELLPEVRIEPDVAVVILGANDAMILTRPDEWATRLDALIASIQRLRTDGRVPRVVVTGVPPFLSFPLLPRALARFLDGRAAQLDAASRRVCARPGVTWVPMGPLLPEGGQWFAVDGFHPSPAGYAVWAAAVSHRTPLPAPLPGR